VRQRVIGLASSITEQKAGGNLSKWGSTNRDYNEHAGNQRINRKFIDEHWGVERLSAEAKSYFKPEAQIRKEDLG